MFVHYNILILYCDLNDIKYTAALVKLVTYIGYAAGWRTGGVYC